MRVRIDCQAQEIHVTDYIEYADRFSAGPVITTISGIADKMFPSPPSSLGEGLVRRLCAR